MQVSVETGAAEKQVARFRRSIVAASVLPWISVIVLHHLQVGGEGALLTLATVVAAGHVGTTVQFYVDPALNLLKKDPWRYVIAPVGLIVGAVAGITAGGHWNTTVVLVLTVWQIHHFTRQNLGMFSLYAKARGGTGLSDRERRLFDLTTGAGVCGVIGLVVDVPVRPLGLGFLTAAVILLVLERPESWRLLALTAAVAFYLPLYIYTPTLGVAVGSYAIAHGTQYLVMMGYVRVRSTIPVAAGAVYALAFWTETAVPFYVGVTLSHFVIDAGVWKMRDPDQRKWLGAKLPWLMQPRT